MKLVIHAGNGQPAIVEDRPVIILADAGGAPAVSPAANNAIERRPDGIYAPSNLITTDW